MEDCTVTKTFNNKNAKDCNFLEKEISKYRQDFKNRFRDAPLYYRKMFSSNVVMNIAMITLLNTKYWGFHENLRFV